MEAQNKIKLIEEIIQTEDDLILNQIREILDSHTLVVGYDVDGTPISKADLLKSLQKGENQITEKKTFSHEEVVKMAEKL